VLVDVPDIDVHAAHDTLLTQPERDELAIGWLAPKDDLVPRRGVPRAMLGEPVSYDRIPYFFSDQYDVGMEYSG
jgi:hypothetical protein